MVRLNYTPCPKCGQKFIQLPKLGYDECQKCREKSKEPPVEDVPNE
jgi:DNA-directed RNA polymerase subunit RPC12/RpoP